MQMIQGLAVGVGAFAESAATQGRSGGPEEVQRFQAEKQREQAVAQESQQSAQRAQREQQEGDLRIKALRGNMAIDQFKLEQMRLTAPLAIQKAQNEIADQHIDFMEKLSKLSGLPLMVIQSLSNDDTKSTLGAINDTASKNGTTIHDAMWAHVQNDHGPGNGSKVVGLDLAKFGNTILKPDLASAAILPVKTQIDVGAGVLGEDDPAVKAGRQAFQYLQQGLASGQVTVQDYALLANRITAPIASAMGVKHATLASEKEQAETTRAQQESDPAFQVSQAGKVEGAKQAAELPYVGKKAAATAKANQPYQVALKQLEVPIAEGVASNKEAREAVQKGYVQPFLDKMDGARELVSSLAQAESGNAAASKAAIFKMAGMALPASGKRGFSDAVYALEKQGNIPQQYIGSIKEALTGDKWTSKMSQDMKDFAAAQINVAKDTLRSGVKVTNALHGTKIDPEALIQAAGPLDIQPAGPQAGKWGNLIPSGNTLKP